VSDGSSAKSLVIAAAVLVSFLLLLPYFGINIFGSTQPVSPAIPRPGGVHPGVHRRIVEHQSNDEAENTAQEPLDITNAN
jgi:hypothetical protein